MLLAASGTVDAPTRATLRKELTWEGYAMIAQGIYGHPVAGPEAIEEILARLGVQGKLLVVRAAELPGVSSRPLRELAAEGWDLSAVVQGYRGFIEQFTPLLQLLEQTDPQALAPEQAFVMIRCCRLNCCQIRGRVRKRMRWRGPFIGTRRRRPKCRLRRRCAAKTLTRRRLMRRICCGLGAWRRRRAA